MTNLTLSPCISFISNQIEIQEDLSVSLRQAEALAYMALRDDFENAPNDLVRYYLWALSDIVVNAKQLNAQSLSDMLSFYQSNSSVVG